MSPVLLLGFFSVKAEEMFITLDTLLIPDKELAEPLGPWFEIPMDVPLPEFSHDVVDLLAGQAQMDVRHFKYFMNYVYSHVSWNPGSSLRETGGARNDGGTTQTSKRSWY
jgi:hypothetical protein